MKSFNLATAIAIVIASIGVKADQTSRRLIVGGETVEEGQFKYTVGVRATANGCTNCGGTLIHERLVLTSARCATRDSDDFNPKFAAIGQHLNIGTDIDAGEVIKIEKVAFFPGYNNETNLNDVALLFLEKKSLIKPVKFGDDPPLGSKVWAFGWGRTSDSDDSLSTTLQRVELQVKDRDCCQMFAMHYSDSNLCVGSSENKDICKNDFGGPLIVEGQDKTSNDDDRLVGMISIGAGDFGESCGAGDPSVSIRISHIAKWVQEVINTLT